MLATRDPRPAPQRLSVHKFPLDRLDEAVQEPAFLMMIEQGWRPVLTWVVEEERARGSIPPTMLVVLAPPYTPTAPPVEVKLEAPAAPPVPFLTRAAPVAVLVLLVAILASLWLT